MRRLLFALATFLQAGGQPVPIPVSANWTLGNGSHQVQLSDGTPAIIAGYGSSFSQILSVTPAELQAINPGYFTDVIYELMLTGENEFQVYPGYYTIKLSFGAQELCESSGWGSASLINVPIVCYGPKYLVADRSLQDNGASGPVQGYLPLTITISVGGWPILFKTDNVSLTFTPTN